MFCHLNRLPEKLPAALLPWPFSTEPLPSVHALKRSWCRCPEVPGIDLFWKEQILTLRGSPSTCQSGDPTGREGAQHRRGN